MIKTEYRLNTPVSIALLGDLHGRPYEKITESLKLHQPQLIIIAGDIIYGSQPEEDVSPLVVQENVLPSLSAFASIAPTYLSLGNHEWMLDAEDLQQISSTGVIILDNNWITTTVEGRSITIGGLTSAYVTDYRRFRDGIKSIDTDSARYPKKEMIGTEVTALDRVPEISWLSGFAATEGFKILACHHPEYVNLIPHDVDLILSSHCHGGQIRLYNPIKRSWFGLFAPGQRWLPKYTKGVYGRMVVSAGLSNTTWVPRICNPTEIVYIAPSDAHSNKSKM